MDSNLVCLVNSRSLISKKLGVEDGVPQFWSNYRKITAQIGRDIKGEKNGNKWYVDKKDLNKFLKKRKVELVSKGLVKNQSTKCVTKKTKETKKINEIKKIIKELQEVEVPTDKILAIICKRLNIKKAFKE